jgi:hypothetical protein
VSYWHLFYSRVAHWSISYGTVLLAALLLFMLGMNTKSRWWFLASGLALGSGFYTYNIYPIAVIAFAVFVAIMTVMYYRGPELRWWLGSTAITFGAAFIVALPMIGYVANPDSFYWYHIDNYSDVGVRRTDEYRDANAFGKARLLAEQAGTFVDAYVWDAPLDYVDGNGRRPVFDLPTVALLAVGLVIAVRRRREPMVVAALCCFIIIPLPAVPQNGSIMRQPLAAAPFAMFIAALPLAALWRWAVASRERVGAAAFALPMIVVAAISFTTVRDYFWTVRKDDWVRYIYYSQMTTASDYMRDLPDGTFVLFYNERASINLETRQFLAPDVEGFDRSYEFGGDDAGSLDILDPSRPTVFVLMDGYDNLLPDIEAQHPGGNERIITRDGKLEFYAYEVPAE